MYYVYILRTDKNTLYTGYTVDIEKRLQKHRDGKGAKYLRNYDSFQLVHIEEYITLSEALKREYAIKQMSKSAKEAIIK